MTKLLKFKRDFTCSEGPQNLIKLNNARTTAFERSVVNTSMRYFIDFTGAKSISETSQERKTTCKSN